MANVKAVNVNVHLAKKFGLPESQNAFEIVFNLRFW